MTDYGKFYFDKLGKEIGIAKRLISAYSYERVIGASITRQGDNYQIPTWNIVQAKDYVASLTDTKVIKEYRKYLEVIES